MIKFDVHDDYTFVSGCTPYIHQEINILLARLDPDRESHMDYLTGQWDGFIKYFVDGEKFLTGLLPRVLDMLTLQGESWEFEGDYYKWLLHQEWLDVPEDIIPGLTLRDYQVTSIQKCLYYKRGIVEIATGGGKTEVIIGLTKMVGEPTLIIVPSSRGLDEIYQRFLDYGFTTDEVGRLGDGFQDVRGITVAIINSIHAGIKSHYKLVLKLLRTTELLIGDEIHHLSANSWSRAFDKCKARYRFGFSGTPFEDYLNPTIRDLTCLGLLGNRIVYVPYSYLATRGFLARAYFVMLPTKCPTKIPYSDFSNWHKVKKKGLIDNEARNALVVTAMGRLYDEGGKVLTIIDEIRHGKGFLQSLSPFTVEAELAWGGSSLSRVENGEIIDEELVMDDLRVKYKNMERGVLIGSPIFKESVNMPSFNFIIVACGGKNHRYAIQRAGRVLRAKEGSNVAFIIDFHDGFNKILARHSNERRKHYLKEGYTELPYTDLGSFLLALKTEVY